MRLADDISELLVNSIFADNEMNIIIVNTWTLWTYSQSMHFDETTLA
jgi:hypothetical protein